MCIAIIKPLKMHAKAARHLFSLTKESFLKVVSLQAPLF